MSNKEYSNGSQERLLDVLLTLSGNEFLGLAPSEICRALGTSPSNVSRDLRVLRKKGLAEELPETGRWRLGPKLIQMAHAFDLHVQAMQQRLDQVKQRYTRTPR